MTQIFFYNDCRQIVYRKATVVYLKVHFQAGAKAPEWPQVKAFPWRG